jgi:uncharacterized protein (DUF2461 family)
MPPDKTGRTNMQQPESSFTGFTQRTIDFFNALEANNTKAWFSDHRREFDEFVLLPLQNLVILKIRVAKIISN